MIKTNQTIKKQIVSCFNLLVILFILFNKTNIANGADNNWMEVSKTPNGIQYIDRNSLNNKDKGVIELKTKYLKIDANTSNKIEENIYIMKINCLTSKFKDIAVNGKRNLSADWKDPNMDKLINDVIIYTCKNV